MTTTSWCLLALGIALGIGCERCKPEPICDTSSPDQNCFDDPAINYEIQAQTCSGCHPLQMEEWQGSIMHYAAVSPVFNAFELTARDLTEGRVASDGESPNFCVRCHAPMADYNGEIPDHESAAEMPASAYFSDVSQEGLNCMWCHSITSSDHTQSLLNDGIANLSLKYEPSETLYGPIEAPWPSAYHPSSEYNDFFSDAEFCGSCHDVRPIQPDLITEESGVDGEDFQRLEDLFTDWQSSTYNSTDNPYGQVITCQDCHMSLFPQADPGCYAQGAVAGVLYEDQMISLGPEDRRHALHAFTAVSIPLIASDEFPNIDTDAVRTYTAMNDDACGTAAGQEIDFPLGQQQRREQMLQAAALIEITDDTTDSVTATDTHIHIEVQVTNHQTGHNLPAGFSQERQLWIELIVTDDAGDIYSSGVLTDKAHPETGEDEPDGLLHDEDLDSLLFEFHDDEDILAFTPEPVEGADVDQRPHGVNLGIVNFQNRFIVCHNDDCSGFIACQDGPCSEEDAASWEVTLNPFITDHMDNSQAIPPNSSQIAVYDVPLPERALVGDISISVKLRYRSFPPEFLRFLAQRMALKGIPDLVTEELIDQNTTVDMASASDTIRNDL